MSRKSTKLKIVIVAVAVIALGAVAGVTYAIVGGGDMAQQNSDTNSAPALIKTENRASIYPTEDGFTRYFQGVQNGNATIKKEDVHAVPTLNWNEQAIAVVPFDVLSSQTYQSVNLEAIDGKKSIVVDVLDSPKNCMVTQDNKNHLAFLRMTQDEAKLTYPVVVRINPNSAGCEN